MRVVRVYYIPYYLWINEVSKKMEVLKKLKEKNPFEKSIKRKIIELRYLSILRIIYVVMKNEK